MRALAAFAVGLWMIACRPAQNPELGPVAKSAFVQSDTSTADGGDLERDGDITTKVVDRGVPGRGITSLGNFSATWAC